MYRPQPLECQVESLRVKTVQSGLLLCFKARSNPPTRHVQSGNCFDPLRDFMPAIKVSALHRVSLSRALSVVFSALMHFAWTHLIGA